MFQEPDVQTLIQLFIDKIKQQHLAPQILPFQNQVFRTIKNEIDQYKKREKMFLKDSHDNSDQLFDRNFRYLIHNAEKQKIDYLLKLYLRIRLQKIQKFAFFLAKNPSITQKTLSIQQKTFLNDYAKLKYKYFRQNALSLLNKNYQGLAGLQTKYQDKKEERIYVQSKQAKIEVVEPNSEAFCFIKILRNPRQLRYNQNIKAVNVPLRNFEMIISDDIVFGPYRQIKELIEKGQAQLI